MPVYRAMDSIGLDSELYQGALIAGRYRLLRILGRGGMGVVWLADDRRLGATERRVALKFLFDTAQGRRQREAALLARISNPNVVRLLGVGETAKGWRFLVLSFVPGQTLCAMVKRGGRVSYRMAATIAQQLGDALEHVHGQDIIHRDVKPQNILVRREGARLAVTLVDFGVAIERHLANGSELSMLVGTPGFMAPEQFFAVDVDERTDQFALACTLYYLLTGERPFERPGVWTMFSTTPRPVDELAVVPAGASAALGRALLPDPCNRFPSVRSFVAAFCAAFSQFRQPAATCGHATMLPCVASAAAASREGAADDTHVAMTTRVDEPPIAVAC